MLAAVIEGRCFEPERIVSRNQPRMSMLSVDWVPVCRGMRG